jgi:predicted transcriptional regulator
MKKSTIKYNNEENELAAFAKLLAHPARVAIVNRLLETDQCFCGELVLDLPLSQSTVSRHLLVLKNAGLIQGETAGVNTCYCIHLPTWKKMTAKLQGFLSQTPILQKKCC